MESRMLPIIRQLINDFPDTDFDYSGIHLIVNGKKIRTFLTAEELAPHDPVKPNSRSYYQLFCNIVFNHFHIEPRSGSFADRLIIDEEEGRKAAIAKWFAEKRIAFLENDGEITALKYEVEGDTAPLQQLSYEEAAALEPLKEQESGKPCSGGTEQDENKPLRTPREQAEWERKITALKEEGEKIKSEMVREQQERDSEKKSGKKQKRGWFRKKS